MFIHVWSANQVMPDAVLFLISIQLIITESKVNPGSWLLTGKTKGTDRHVPYGLITFILSIMIQLNTSCKLNIYMYNITPSFIILINEITCPY